MRQGFMLSAIKLLLVFAVFADVFGQTTMSSSNIASALTGEFAIPSAVSALQPGTILPSDNSINEDEYLVGSGDVFFAAAVESPTVRYTIAVDQSGRAFIPNIGLVNVGKTTYAEAKKVFAESIASILRNPSEVYVTLIQTKKVTVSFTGMVHSPGSHVFPGTMRLLDAVVAANNGIMPEPAEADLRGVELIRGDHVAVYDLSGYLHKRDNTQNPYLYPGDRIRVNPTTVGVFVSGALITPIEGFYPIKTGETLAEFMSMFTLHSTADTNNIIIFRSIDNSKKTVSLSDGDYVLNDRDAITVSARQNIPGIFTVQISGEVAGPGYYPIVENVTTVRQLIDMAGGPKESANMEQAIIVRTVKSLPEQLIDGAEKLAAVRPEGGTAVGMVAALQDHLIIRLKHYNHDRLILEQGDMVVIPKKDPFVYLSGRVKNPGAYPFRHERNVGYYIAAAGGFSSNANKSNVQIFATYGDFVQLIEPQCIEPGNVIVVPSSVQYKFFSQVALPLVTALATTIGVGISIYSLGRNSGR